MNGRPCIIEVRSDQGHQRRHHLTLNRGVWEDQGDATVDSRGMGRRRQETPHPPPEVADNGMAHAAAAPGCPIAERGVGGRPVTSPSCFSSSANRKLLRRHRVGLPNSSVQGLRRLVRGEASGVKPSPAGLSEAACSSGRSRHCMGFSERTRSRLQGTGVCRCSRLGSAASSKASLERPAGIACPAAAHGALQAPEAPRWPALIVLEEPTGPPVVLPGSRPVIAAANAGIKAAGLVV